MIVQKHNSNLTFHILHELKSLKSMFIPLEVQNQILTWSTSNYNLMIMWASLSVLECIPTPTLIWNLLRLSPQIELQVLQVGYGSWWWRCYRTWMMDWMSYIWCVDGVWTKKLGNARVVFDLAGFGPKWPLMEVWKWFGVGGDLAMCEWIKHVCLDV